MACISITGAKDKQRDLRAPHMLQMRMDLAGSNIITNIFDACDAYIHILVKFVKYVWGTAAHLKFDAPPRVRCAEVLVWGTAQWTLALPARTVAFQKKWKAKELLSNSLNPSSLQNYMRKPWKFWFLPGKAVPGTLHKPTHNLITLGTCPTNSQAPICPNIPLKQLQGLIPHSFLPSFFSKTACFPCFFLSVFSFFLGWLPEKKDSDPSAWDFWKVPPATAKPLTHKGHHLDSLPSRPGGPGHSSVA